MNINKIICIIAASLLLNVGSVFYMRGSYEHFLIVTFGVLYVALPISIIGIVLFIIGRKLHKTRMYTISKYVFISSLFIASIWLSYPIGSKLLEKDIKEAKAYCESVIPQLEEYKKINGVYPVDIKTFKSSQSIPRILVNEPFYNSDGMNFQFSFIDPASFSDVYGFNSTTRQWYTAN